MNYKIKQHPFEDAFAYLPLLPVYDSDRSNKITKITYTLYPHYSKTIERHLTENMFGKHNASGKQNISVKIIEPVSISGTLNVGSATQPFGPLYVYNTKYKSTLHAETILAEIIKQRHNELKHVQKYPDQNKTTCLFTGDPSFTSLYVMARRRDREKLYECFSNGPNAVGYYLSWSTIRTATEVTHTNWRVHETLQSAQDTAQKLYDDRRHKYVLRQLKKK